jgi:hypothetical protein
MGLALFFVLSLTLQVHGTDAVTPLTPAFPTNPKTSLASSQTDSHLPALPAAQQQLETNGKPPRIKVEVTNPPTQLPQTFLDSSSSSYRPPEIPSTQQLEADSRPKSIVKQVEPTQTPPTLMASPSSPSLSTTTTTNTARLATSQNVRNLIASQYHKSARVGVSGAGPTQPTNQQATHTNGGATATTTLRADSDRGAGVLLVAPTTGTGTSVSVVYSYCDSGKCSAQQKTCGSFTDCECGNDGTVKCVKNWNMLGITIAGIILGLIAIVLLIWCFCCRRRDDEED